MDDTSPKLTRNDSRPPHGCRRLDDHPVLGPLPPTAAVEFAFQGRSMTGRSGEPILAALLAAGVRVCRTMPQSGEVRGGYCLVGRCSDCLMQVDGEPNVRTCITPVRAGLRVEPQDGRGQWSGGSTSTVPKAGGAG